jgi:hypothetical protein
MLLEYLGHFGTDSLGRGFGDGDKHDGEADGDSGAGLQVTFREQ